MDLCQWPYDASKSASGRYAGAVLGMRRYRRGAAVEALEDRRLMSLTIELRATNGASAMNVSFVGQVVTLDIVGVVTAGKVGTDDSNISANAPSTFGISDLTGSFLSTGIYSHDVAGNLSASVATAFEADGFQEGTKQDLNGDGNVDVGSNSAASIAGYFFARHGIPDTNGTVSGTSNSILLGTLTYTITNLGDGGETDINFRPRPSSALDEPFYYSANWFDGVEYNASGLVGQYADDLNSTFGAGSPFVITDKLLNPAPVVNPVFLSTPENTALTFNALANVTTSDALVPSSVVIATAPAHGKVGVSAAGSITYTPATGYSGADSFTYHVTDSNGKVSNTGKVSVTVVSPVTSKLVFLQQPTATVAGKAISPAVKVEIEDSTGKVLTGNTSTVTVSLASGPTGAVLNQSAKAVNGIATFSDVVLTLASSSYKLDASDAGVTSAASGTFSITAGAASELVFGTLPSGTVVGKAIASPLTVSVEDKYANLTAVSGTNLTLSIASGPTGGAISGTVSVTVAGGKASFAGLSFTRPGSYKLKATFGSISATSGTIAVGVTNVTSKVSITKGTAVFNSKTDQYSQLVTVKNTSTSSITGPIELLLSGLTTGVTLATTHATSTVVTPTGSAYVLLATTSTTLAVGQSLSITLLFNDPKKLAFSYTASVYAGSSVL